MKNILPELKRRDRLSKLFYAVSKGDMLGADAIEEVEGMIRDAEETVLNSITEEAHRVVTVWDLKDFYKYLESQKQTKPRVKSTTSRMSRI